MFNSGATLQCHRERINKVIFSEMPKCSKGKGTSAAKVPKVTKARATRASSDGSRPQQSGRSEGEDALSSSVIGREDVALVVEEVLKTLRQRDVALSGPDRNGGTPSSGMTSECEATSSRSQAADDLHLPG